MEAQSSGFTAKHLEESRKFVILATQLLSQGMPQTVEDLTTCERAITGQRIGLVAMDQDLRKRGIRHDVNVDGACSVASKALQEIARQKRMLNQKSS